MAKDDDIIVELLKEVRDEQKNTTEVGHKHTIILTTMRADVSQNTKDLKDHMKRSDTLEELLTEYREDSHSRLVSLEKPYEFVQTTVKLLKWAGGISGSILVIAGLGRLLGLL